MNVSSIQLIPVGTAGTASVTSVAYDLGGQSLYSISVDFSGSNLVGTLTLEGSNNSDTAGFTTILNSSQAVTASADHMWNVSQAGYRWVRVVWVFTSGTGNIASKLTVK